MGVLHMPTAAGHHPLKSCPRHEAPPTIILKSVTFTMTTDSPPRAPPLVCTTLQVQVVSRDLMGSCEKGGQASEYVRATRCTLREWSNTR
jgi:hypothetical protein